MRLNQVRDPVCDDACLTAAGAGQEQQRALDMRHRSLLLRIEALEKIH